MAVIRSILDPLVRGVALARAKALLLASANVVAALPAGVDFARGALPILWRVPLPRIDGTAMAPQGEGLPGQEIEMLCHWIGLGAAWPESTHWS